MLTSFLSYPDQNILTNYILEATLKTGLLNLSFPLPVPNHREKWESI